MIFNASDVLFWNRTAYCGGTVLILGFMGFFLEYPYPRLLSVWYRIVVAVFPAFVDGATGTQGLETDTGLTYNPSSGLLTSNAFTSTTSVTAASFVTTGNAITIADNEITTGSSNADINITPNGTGTVQTGPLTSSGAVVGTSFTTTGNAITIADNEITTGSSNADIVIDTHGTGDINLTAGADVVIPANIGLTFGTGEKIEGDNTDITVTSGGAIKLTATTDVVVPDSSANKANVAVRGV